METSLLHLDYNIDVGQLLRNATLPNVDEKVLHNLLLLSAPNFELEDVARPNFELCLGTR